MFIVKEEFIIKARNCTKLKNNQSRFKFKAWMNEC